MTSHNTQNKFDVICLSETYLDSSNTIEDQRLILNGFKSIRADNPIILIKELEPVFI